MPFLIWLHLAERLKKNYRLIIVSLFPVILYFVNRDWVLYDNPYGTMIDPWLYNGYFLNFEHYYQMFGQTYYGDRISWILPGYILHHILPPLYANAALHLIFSVISIASLYLILKITVDERSALVASIAMGAYPYFIRELGSNYLTGGIITYLLLTFLMITLVLISPHERIFPCLGGIFFAFAIYTNFFTVLFAPFILAYCFIINKKIGRNPYVSIGYFVGGFLLSSAVFGIIFFFLTKNPLFFSAQLRNAVYYLTITNNQWFIPIQTWYYRGYWLIMPVFIFITSLLYLLIVKMKKIKITNYFISFFQIIFISIFLLYVLLNFRNIPALQLQYYTDQLIPFIFLAFGSQIYFILKNMKENQLNIFLLFWMTVLVLPFAFAQYSPLYMIFSGNTTFIQMIIISICIVTLIVYLVGHRKESNFGVIAFSILLVLLLFFFYTIPENNESYVRFSINNPDSYENGYLAVIDSVHTIEATIPQGNLIKFWYNASERRENYYYGGIFNNINSMYLWGYTWIGRDFPTIEKKNVDNLKNNLHNTLIVILTTNEDGYQLAQKSLNDLGYSPKLLRTIPINRGHIQFNCIFIRIESS